MQDYMIGETIYTRDNPIHRYTMPCKIAQYAKMLVSSLGDSIVGQTIYMSIDREIIEIR